MRKINADADVRQLAYQLGLDWEKDAADQILRYCRRKIERWLSVTEVTSVTALEELVAGKLHLRFEEVWNQRDLEGVVERYLALGEGIFLGIEEVLDGNNLGTLIKLRQVREDDAIRFVALIDCRGENSYRRFFTRWHEIAHLLTETFQSSAGIEALMDVIAAEFAFYPPIFVPFMLSRVAGRPRLSFEDIRIIRDGCCSTASLQAVTHASINCMSSPVLYVEAEEALKKSEQNSEALGQVSLFAEYAPQPKLRAVKVVPNQAARDLGLYIHPNMRVPSESSIMRIWIHAQTALSGQSTRHVEDLSWWVHSDGKRLKQIAVSVEVQRLDNRVLALIHAI